MNVAHLHLLLNHFPTIGTIVGLGLLLLSLVRKSDPVRRASLEVFCAIALLALPVYLSGTAAGAVLEGTPGVSATAIETHEDAALLALVFMEITGAVAWFALWQYRRTSRPAGWHSSTVLIFSIVTLLLMARTATQGGEIRHPEILADQSSNASEGAGGAGPVWLKAASIASFVSSRPWVWPASETLHFIGLCLLFGVVLVVNLRILGMMKRASFAALGGLLPFGMAGFAMNTITGLLFFVAAPDQYTQNPVFYWKILLILLAGGNVLYLMGFDEVWAVGPGDDAPLTGKVIAASGIGLWIGVIYAGRMLPFLGNAF